MGCQYTRDAVLEPVTKLSNVSPAILEARLSGSLQLESSVPLEDLGGTCGSNISSKLSTCQSSVSTANSGSGGPPRIRRKSTRTMSRQAAGHAGSVLHFHEEAEDNSKQAASILKVLEEVEVMAYERLYSLQTDPIHDFVARYYGEVLMESHPSQEEGLAGEPERYIRLSNLLRNFHQPFVMDVKVGVRSFVEDEAKSIKPRADLFQRMQELDPSEPTPEEKAAGAISKFRWMSWRDRMSSSQSLGFRVDGIAGPEGLKLKQNDFAAVRERHEVVRELLDFLPPPRWRSSQERKLASKNDASEDTYELEEVLRLKLGLANSFRKSLLDLRTACEASPFFRSHEFVGASVLLAVEAQPPKAQVFLIDFAKTHPLPPEVSVDHQSPWVLGNHEDGVLWGVANCADCWGEVAAKLQKELDDFVRISTL